MSKRGIVTRGQAFGPSGAWLSRRRSRRPPNRGGYLLRNFINFGEYSVPPQKGAAYETASAQIWASWFWPGAISLSVGTYATTSVAKEIKASIATFQVGGYTLTGESVAVTKVSKVKAQAGTFALTGENATERKTSIGNVQTVSYSLTGENATLKKGSAQSIQADFYSVNALSGGGGSGAFTGVTTLAADWDGLGANNFTSPATAADAPVGSLIILAAQTYPGSGKEVLKFVDTVGNTYQLAAKHQNNDSDHADSSEIWYSLSTADLPSGSHLTITLTDKGSTTGSTSSFFDVMAVYCCKGYSGGLDAGFTNFKDTPDGGTSGSVVSTAATSDYFVAALTGVNGAYPSFTDDPAFTLLDNPAAEGNTASWKRGTAATSTYSPSWTFSGGTGANTLLQVAFKADAGGGTSGEQVTLLKDSLVKAQSGSYALTDEQINLLKTSLLSIQEGSYSLTGESLTIGLTFPAFIFNIGTGLYSLTDETLTLAKGSRASLQAGVYNLTGEQLKLLKTSALKETTGTYTLTGEQLTLKAARKGSAQAGTYSLAGENEVLKVAHLLAASMGSYAFTGESLTVTFSGPTNFTMPIGTGTYSLTDENLTLVKKSKQGLQVGVYSLTDEALQTLRGSRLSGTAGTYTLTGEALKLKAGRLVAPQAGLYSFTSALTFRRKSLLNSATGFYTDTGSNLNLVLRVSVLTPRTVSLNAAESVPALFAGA